MDYEQEERMVTAIEWIAEALRGLNDRSERAFAKQYPERERKEAIGSRVPTAEDIIKEKQGVSDKPAEEWLTGDGEFIGQREREFLAEQKKKQASDSQG